MSQDFGLVRLTRSACPPVSTNITCAGPHEVEQNVFQLDFEVDESAITSNRIASNKKISMKKVEWDELTLKELDCANRQLDVGRNDWAGHKDVSYATF